MKYQLYFPIEQLSSEKDISERALAEAAGVSRAALRQIKKAEGNLTLSTIDVLASYFERNSEVLVCPQTIHSEFSTLATAYKIERDGFDSWKIHIMDLLDEYRRYADPRLVLLPPHRGFDFKLTALMASLVRHSSVEIGLPCPPWALKRFFLSTPWFPAAVESLKAIALLESPMAFRNNNIFVQENFTTRA